jgi:ubiquinone/menaquinone biosynthesis C-methylase UbiE
VEENEYILGTHRAEIERLRVQHTTWVEQSYRLFRRARLGAGQTVADLGCGPGFTTLELTRCVGPEGRVIAVDRSQRFLDYLDDLCAREGIRNVEPILADVEQIDLPPATLDAAYARWLLCWVPDAGVVIERAARMVKPGGAFVLQEYLDWDVMKLIPLSAPFRAAVEACMQSWVVGNATINIAEQIPSLARQHGFAVEYFEPISRIGKVGSLEWRWVMGFLRSYLPGLIGQGLFTNEALAAFEADYQARNLDGSTFVYTPTMTNIILRRL